MSSATTTTTSTSCGPVSILTKSLTLGFLFEKQLRMLISFLTILFPFNRIDTTSLVRYTRLVGLIIVRLKSVYIYIQWFVMYKSKYTNRRQWNGTTQKTMNRLVVRSCFRERVKFSGNRENDCEHMMDEMEFIK